MSKYIPGIVDYVSKIQPFKPNLNFFQQVLETKEAQYKAGYDKLSSLYGTLLESPMLRTENIELRNKFFNDISSQITKISSMDLSLSQNVDAASNVFQPLIDNDYIMKDMAYTKQAYAELSKADYFKNCTDEKKCGGKYWEGGVRAVQYQMADFAKSSADESLKFTSPTYTPYVNIPKKAMEFAKEMGFNMQTVTWSPDGRYRITTKNGQQMIPSLTDAFMASFGNDQQARDYYNTSAYLTRKDFIATSSTQYGSEEAAEAYYLDQMSKDLFGKSMQETQRIQSDIDKAKNTEAVSDQIISTVGVDPSNKDDQKFIANRNQAIVDQLISNAAKDQHTQTQEVLDPETFQIVDINAQRNRIDSAVANSLFTTDLVKTAQNYANLTVEQKVEEDRYALSAYDHSLAMSRMAAQHKYDLDKMSRQQAHDKEMEKIRTVNDILIKSFGEGKDGKANGTPEGESADWMSALGAYLSGSQSAEDVDLEKSDQEAFTTQQQENEANLRALSEKTLQILNDIGRLENGVKIPGTEIEITPEVKRWAEEKKMSMFGKSEKVEVDVYNDDWSSDIPWYQYAANIFLPESMEYKGKEKKQEIRGGYLDENGKLVDFNTHEDFKSSDANKNGYGLSQRIKNGLNDPLSKMVLGDMLIPSGKGVNENANLGDYVKAYNDSEILYSNYATRLAENKKAVANAVIGARADNLVEEAMNRDYAKQMIDKSFKSGNFPTRDEFINAYVSGMPPDNTNYGNVPYYSSLSTREQRARGEAGDIYDRFKDLYQATYNQSPGDWFDTKAVVDSVPGYSNMKFGFIKDKPGAGIQAESRTYYVDSAYRGDVSAHDYRSLMVDLRNNMTGAQVFTGDHNPFDLDLDDGTNFNESTDVKKVLDVINGNFIAGAKTTDEGRARFNMAVHPMIGGNTDKVGFTIELDPGFYAKNKKKNGSLEGIDSNKFTIVMDAANVKADSFQRLKRGPYQLIMDMNPNGYNMSEYNKYGGDLKVTSNPNGGYNAKGTVKGVDETGKLVDLYYDVNSGTTATADQFIPAQYQVLQQINNEVKAYVDMMRQVSPDLITDPNFGKPQQ